MSAAHLAFMGVWDRCHIRSSVLWKSLSRFPERHAEESRGMERSEGSFRAHWRLIGNVQRSDAAARTTRKTGQGMSSRYDVDCFIGNNCAALAVQKVQLNAF